jgi:hypothetical protein
MTIEKDAAEAAEFADVLAELEADEGDTVSEEATPEADSVEGDPEADEESEDEESEDEDSEELEDPAATADVEIFRDELAELLDGGDLKALATKLGKDPSIFKLNNRQFKAARVAERNANRLKAEADQALQAGNAAKTQGEQLEANARRIYGPAAAGFQAYQAGDPSGVRAAVEAMTGDTFENVVAAVARAAKGMDPGQVEVIKLRRELAAEKARQTAEQASQAAKAEETSQVTQIASKLASTPLAALADEAAADIFKVLQASKHPTLGKYTKTLKEAYAEVKAVYAAKAAKLATVAAGKKGAKVVPPKDKRAPLARTPIVTRPAGGKKMTPEEEFKAELKAAERDTQTQERKRRRAR